MAARMGRSLAAARVLKVLFRSLPKPLFEFPGRHFSSMMMAVQVGSTLKIDLQKVCTNVKVTAGEDLEQIHVEGVDHDEQSVEATKYLDVTTTADTISVGRSMHGRTDYDLLKSLRVVMPERWCTLHLDAGSGDVQVQSINEADLIVNTSAGDILLGRIKGREACISSGGGSCTADMVSAVCRINSLGGSVSVKKLVGTSIDINTAGGGLHIGWLYGDDVNLQTSGGAVTMEHIRATKMATIVTGGGNAMIKGLDGKASINSSGGDIEVQLHDAAQELIIDSGEGAVVIYLSSQVAAKLEHSGTGQFDMRIDGEVDEFQPETGVSRRAEGYVGPCTVKVSGSGNVTVRRRSWLESRVRLN